MILQVDNVDSVGVHDGDGGYAVFINIHASNDDRAYCIEIPQNSYTMDLEIGALIEVTGLRFTSFNLTGPGNYTARSITVVAQDA